MSEEVKDVKDLTDAEVAEATVQLSSEELLLLNRNADQFRHYINKKAKRLKLEVAAKKREGSITEKEQLT